MKTDFQREIITEKARRGLTYADMAKITGLSAITIAGYVSSGHGSHKTAVKIAHALGIDMTKFFTY